MPECCRTQSTKYCPECGTDLQMGTYQGLVRYLDFQVKRYERDLVSAKQGLADNPEDYLDRSTRQIDRVQNKVIKWTQWAKLARGFQPNQEN